MEITCSLITPHFTKQNNLNDNKSIKRGSLGTRPWVCLWATNIIAFSDILHQYYCKYWDVVTVWHKVVSFPGLLPAFCSLQYRKVWKAWWRSENEASTMYTYAATSCGHFVRYSLSVEASPAMIAVRMIPGLIVSNKNCSWIRSVGFTWSSSGVLEKHKFVCTCACPTCCFYYHDWMKGTQTVQLASSSSSIAVYYAYHPFGQILWAIIVPKSWLVVC